MMVSTVVLEPQGVYRCVGRGLKHPNRRITRIQVICGLRYVSWQSVDGTNRGCVNAGSFASSVLERIA